MNMHDHKKHTYTLLTGLLALMILGMGTAKAEDNPLHVVLEGQASSSNTKTPLWHNANKYGLSTLNRNYAYARVNVEYDHDTLWKYFSAKVGADMVLPFHFDYQGYSESYTSRLIIQQLYTDIRWRNIGICIGIKQQPAQLRNNLLSSGAQTLGINARPIPQGRLYRDTWWEIPGLRKWVGFKGHIAFGITTDAEWQETFAKGTNLPYNRWSRHHEKAGYLRFGKESVFPLTLTVGLEMATQFGGTLYNYQGTDQNGYRGYHYMKLNSNLKSYWNAFLSGGSDAAETKYQNSEGNQLGSRVMRLDWKQPTYAIGIYLDHFFEDHSGLFSIDYDGYGTGEEWNVKKDFKYLYYPMKDFQLGIDLALKDFRYIEGVVLEYMNTTYQSGPIYHDHNEGCSDHLGGIDEYYNHSTMPGWQHWGQAIGNPLYRSPQYNTDGTICFKANRFRAWHGGINGEFTEQLSYRVLYTWQKAFGTYLEPFVEPQDNKSVLIELSYHLHDFMNFHKPLIRLSYASDKGSLLGNNSGFQFTLQYRL